jgi:hypothetical protein
MLSDDETAELAELRRRAWGADADIVDDDEALARLGDLERKAHEAPPPVAEPRFPVAEPPFPVAEPPFPVAEPPFPVAEPGATRPEAPGSAPALSGVGVGSEAPRAAARDDPSTSSGTESGPPVAEPPFPVAEPVEAPHLGGVRRSILLAVGVVVTVLALGAGVRSVLVPTSPNAAPSGAPTATRTLHALACGDGWGPSGASATPVDRPVWSRMFSFPISETWVMPQVGARMLGVWVNLDVPPHTTADVTVVNPSSARLFYTDVKTWTQPPSPDEILANRVQSVVLPKCAGADSYPGFILAAAPTCVTLEFTIDGTTHYTARTPVGIDEGARCPAP